MRTSIGIFGVTIVLASAAGCAPTNPPSRGPSALGLRVPEAPALFTPVSMHRSFIARESSPRKSGGPVRLRACETNDRMHTWTAPKLPPVPMPYVDNTRSLISVPMPNPCAPPVK